MARIAPYLDQHASPSGPGDARPTYIDILKDQSLIDDSPWAGKVVVITGCSPGGLGAETAKALHLIGADVYMTVRDVAKGQQVADMVLEDGKKGKVEVVKMDLAELGSVRKGAREILQKIGGKVNVLITNAGVMFIPEGKTNDGFEMHMAANHFGHFLLFGLLKPALLSAATAEYPSRLLSVSSAAHRYGTIDKTDINFTTRPYDSRVAYGQSKLANVHFANEVDRRYKSQNLRAMSLHPGGIVTPLARYLPEGAMDSMLEIESLANIMKSVEQGAATTVWGAVAKELDDVGGVYLDDCAVAEVVPEDRAAHLPGVAAKAYDEKMDKWLWEESLKLTGIE